MRAPVRAPALAAAAVLLSAEAAAQAPCPREITESGGVCLTGEQRDELVRAIRELEDIHGSKAEVEVLEPIVIVRDWDGRVYVNGGDRKPVRMRLRIGSHVDRDLEARLPTKVFYREEPPDPWFRLRIRAQAGVLVPEAVRSAQNASSDGGLEEFWDAGIGWDFFHVPDWGLNVSAYTGIRSAGGGLGLDLTKNFGPYVGYSLVYDGWRHSVLTGVYFSFN